MLRSDEQRKAFFAKKKLGKRLIIGGPFHSGKSSFMTLLEKDLKERGVNVGILDLDYSSPSIEWIKGEEGERKKQPWTTKLSIIAHDDFKKASKKHDVTLGDSVGKITDITKRLTHGSNAAIILSRRKDEGKKWNKFYKEEGIPVIAKIKSKKTGYHLFNPKKNLGEISNLKRSDLREGKINEDDLVIEAVSHEIGEKFGLNFKKQIKGETK